MQDTPKGTRLHIALFGKRNAGKSSLINAITKQDIALVSNVAGTTTDPVYKAMEILPIGPVMLIDTAGLDDQGDLGQMRVKKSLAVLEKTDVAFIVLDSRNGYSHFEAHIANACQTRKIPVIVVFNQSDRLSSVELKVQIEDYQKQASFPYVVTSALNGQGIEDLKNALVAVEPKDFIPETIVGDMMNPGDTIILVIPIDSAAPKCRIVLPQGQVLRDILDHHGHALVCQTGDLAHTMAQLKNKPALVITDSQAFHEVADIVPDDIPLTSFSILMARYKGDLTLLSHGAKILDTLKPGDKILIAEGCTHHQQKDDIGTVKIPKLLAKRIGGPLQIDFVNGTKFPDDLSQYKMVVHCGACMLNRKEMLYRLSILENHHIPITNYGVLLAELNGILDRSLKPLPLN